MTTPIVPSISDEELAELEESFAPFDGQQSMMIKGLIARLRAAEADAKRYRWLRGQFGVFNERITIPMGYVDDERRANLAAEADEQIDAAMEPKP